MKRFIVAVLALMLIFTEVLSPVQVNAVEKATQCEEKAFTVEPFIVGDEKLEGEGHPGEEIDLQFKDIETTIEVDDEGRFEHVWEEGAPEAGDVITLKSTPYKIELTVEAEMSEREELEAELVDTCEPAAPSEKVEGIEAEDSVEEEATEESSGESGEVDEGSIEEPSLGEESDPKEGAEETPEVGSTEEADLTEEPVVEASDETVPEEDGPAEEEASSEEPVEEKEEEMESVEAAPKEEEPEVEGKEDVKSEGDTDKETDIAKEEVANKQERTEEAESSEEASEEESEEETKEILREKSVEPENRMTRSSMAAVHEVSVESEVPINTIKGSTVRVNSAAEFNDALSSSDVEVIILEKSIHSTSPPAVQSSSEQKIIDANGHSIDLGSSTLEISNGSWNGRWFNTNITQMVVKNAKLFTSNTNNDAGFFKKKDKDMNLILENIEFNNGNSTEGIFGSSWETKVHFYGDNIVNTQSDFYGMAFQKVIVHKGASLCIDHHGVGAALKFERKIISPLNKKYGLEIMDGAKINIYSSSSVFQTALTKLWVPSTLQNNMGKDSTAIFEGGGTTLFDLDTRIDFQIDQPKVVDFHNQNGYGSLFSQDATFNVKEIVRKDWFKGNLGDAPSSEPDTITSGDFKLSSGSNIRRMKLEKPIQPIEVLNIPEIQDTVSVISGTTAPGAEVTITDDSNNVITSTKAGNDGKFTFNLDDRFEVGTVLRFNAKLDNAASETVEKTVIGNRLEFGHVSTSIPFNTTEIKDEEMKIYRQNDNPGIEIVETREDRGWKLSVEATTPLTNENQDTLENALYYFSAGSEPKLIEGTPVPVARGMTSETIEWAPDEGILLKLNPIRAAADTEYKTTIKWILSDGP